MAKQEKGQVKKDTPDIVYRGKTEAQKTKDYSFGFTIAKEQSDWFKANRTKINLSATMRTYLDKVIASEKSRDSKNQ